MGRRGPQPVSPGELYLFAQDFYWSFRRLAEGSTRQFLDKRLYQKLLLSAEKPGLKIGNKRKGQLRRLAEEEIQSGRLASSERDNWLRRREEAELDARRIGRSMIAAELATKPGKIRNEREDLDTLLKATEPEQVRRVCKRANRSPGQWDWPLSCGSRFPEVLSEHAELFIAAKNDPRFPRSGRPSNELKQFWFLSRALAGALFGLRPRTAINLVGSMRPEQVFEESRSGRPTRKSTC